jgi:hypothetical protein
MVTGSKGQAVRQELRNTAKAATGINNSDFMVRVGGTRSNLTNNARNLQHSFLGIPNKLLQDDFPLACPWENHTQILFK